MTETAGHEDQDLRAIRAQRADLRRDLHALEDAVAAALPGRVTAWSEAVHEALVDIAATFERHCQLVEAPDGLFEQVLEASPRLEGAVARLREEHSEIADAITAELRAVRGLQTNGSLDEAMAARQRLDELIATIIRHRQAGADLVYEAYAVDIGVGD